MRRGVLVLLAVLLACTAGLAPPAHADDMFEIDLRLDDEGFSYAYTEVLETGVAGGIRVQVDYESDSATRADFEQEAAEIARIVWVELEGRVLAVDVLSTYEVSWAADILPAAVSFDRDQLQQAHGDRPTGLDEGDPYGGMGGFEDFGFVAGGLLFMLVPVLLLLLLVAAAVGITVAVMRRRQPPSGVGAGGWAEMPAGWPAGPPWPGQPSYGAAQPWPGAQGPWAASSAPGAPWPPQDWARPPG